jgi:hypothetical protein
MSVTLLYEVSTILISYPLPTLAVVPIGNTKGQTKWLRWSRGSVLSFRTKVRGFKPGQSSRNFQGEKNPQHAFLRKGSKDVGPMS